MSLLETHRAFLHLPVDPLGASKVGEVAGKAVWGRGGQNGGMGEEWNEVAMEVEGVDLVWKGAGSAAVVVAKS